MSKYDFKTCRLKITVLTPLHIGNGREMLRDYDYAVHDRRTWRINENALLEAQEVEDPKIVEQLAKAKPVDLVKENEYQDGSPLFRYHIPGEARADQGRVREFIKDVYDHPYLPGSSLKGALRTAIGWWEWSKKQKVARENDLYQPNGKKKRKEFAASDFERDIFGRKPRRDYSGSDPNYDLMRALQVSDSDSHSPDVLHVINVAVFRSAGKQPKINRITSLEIVPQKMFFTVELKLDTVLFSDWARRHGLDLGNGRLITEFATHCKAYTHQRILTEQEYFRQNNFAATSPALKFYDQLSRLENQLPENSFWLQLGWGTGWDGKTFDSRLKESPSENYLKKTVEIYDLGRGHTYLPIQKFPMSRRLPLVGESDNLGKPLGWVLVEVES